MRARGEASTAYLSRRVQGKSPGAHHVIEINVCVRGGPDESAGVERPQHRLHPRGLVRGDAVRFVEHEHVGELHLVGQQR